MKKIYKIGILLIAIIITFNTVIPTVKTFNTVEAAQGHFIEFQTFNISHDETRNALITSGPADQNPRSDRYEFDVQPGKRYNLTFVDLDGYDFVGWYLQNFEDGTEELLTTDKTINYTMGDSDTYIYAKYMRSDGKIYDYSFDKAEVNAQVKVGYQDLKDCYFTVTNTGNTPLYNIYFGSGYPLYYRVWSDDERAVFRMLDEEDTSEPNQTNATMSIPVLEPGESIVCYLYFIDGMMNRYNETYEFVIWGSISGMDYYFCQDYRRLYLNVTTLSRYQSATILNRAEATAYTFYEPIIGEELKRPYFIKQENGWYKYNVESSIWEKYENDEWVYVPYGEIVTPGKYRFNYVFSTTVRDYNSKFAEPLEELVAHIGEETYYAQNLRVESYDENDSITWAIGTIEFDAIKNIKIVDRLYMTSSDFGKPVFGDTLKEPNIVNDFTTYEIDTQNCYWMKRIDGEWVRQNYGDEVTEGAYKYHMEFHIIDPDNYEFSTERLYSGITIEGSQYSFDYYLDELENDETNAIGAVTFNVTDPTKYPKGDLDRNYVVDANDASVALELYKSQSATDEDIAIGDMDENNLIDANDASLILEYYKTHQ